MTRIAAISVDVTKEMAASLADVYGSFELRIFTGFNDSTPKSDFKDAFEYMRHTNVFIIPFSGEMYEKLMALSCCLHIRKILKNECSDIITYDLNSKRWRRFMDIHIGSELL